VHGVNRGLGRGWPGSLGAARLIWKWTRLPEVLLLSGAALTGFCLASDSLPDPLRLALLVLSVLACGGHIMIVNALLGRALLAADSETMDYPIRGAEWRPGALKLLAWVLLAVAMAGLVALAPGAALAGAGIVAVWFLYAHPVVRLKGRPFADTLVHVVAGLLQFFLGALAVPAVLDRRLWLWAVFPTLVLVAGHFHHVIKDVAADRAAGLRTVGVTLGSRSCFVIGSLVFLGAYLHLGWLLAAERWPRGALVLAALTAMSHVVAAVAFGARVSAGEAGAVVRYRATYRALSLLIGTAILWGCLASWNLLG